MGREAGTGPVGVPIGASRGLGGHQTGCLAHTRAWMWPQNPQHHRRRLVEAPHPVPTGILAPSLRHPRPSLGPWLWPVVGALTACSQSPGPQSPHGWGRFRGAVKGEGCSGSALRGCHPPAGRAAGLLGEGQGRAVSLRWEAGTEAQVGWDPPQAVSPGQAAQLGRGRYPHPELPGEKGNLGSSPGWKNRFESPAGLGLPPLPPLPQETLPDTWPTHASPGE